MVKKLFKKEEKWEDNYWRWLVAFIFVFLILGIIIFLVLNSIKDNNNQTVVVDENQYSFDQEVGVVENKPIELPRVTLKENQVLAGVMIDNHFNAWEDQYGLSYSPIVYNVPVEGGATRFMALFDLNEEIEKIGPIRSVRPYYLNYIEEYNATLIHVGGSPEALQNLKLSPVFNLNEMTDAGIYFDRDWNIYQPHNTFISVESIKNAISDYEKDLEYYTPVISFEDKSEVSFDIQKIYIDYSARSTYDIEYVFNVDYKGYERFRAGEKQFDAMTQNPIIVDNIIIKQVPTEIVLDDDLRIALDVLGKGDAQFFINGFEINGSWDKESAKSETYYYDNEGNELKFKPGNIWVEVVPDGHDVTVN